MGIINEARKKGNQNGLSGLDAYENEFYAAVISQPELKTMSMFDYLIDGIICNKVLVKDFGFLCKDINEMNIESNTDKMTQRLEILVSTCAVLYAQIYHKFNLIAQPDKEFIIDLFMSKVFIEKKRQDSIWGPNQNHGVFWLAIIGEEMGEFYEELDHIDRQVPDLKRIDNAIKELIQIAAVCYSWWEKLSDA